MKSAVFGLACLALAGFGMPAGAQMWPTPAGPAEDLTEDEVLENALAAYQAVFYHELGHALIDILELPVLGLEEDAADILSAVLIHELWEPEDSAFKLRAAAGYWAQSAAIWADTGEAPDFGGVHSPDERRYFTYVCLYYGADPENRAEMAAELGLSEGRAATCPQEYELASQSWGTFLDELYEIGPGESLRWTGPEDADDPFAEMIREEIDYLNSILTLPATLDVEIALCDEPNAYYDPSTVSVTMCWELAEWMMGLDPEL
nr:DUF4344 domain-containing metallopeptidase [Pseudotabrizicola algicola]